MAKNSQTPFLRLSMGYLKEKYFISCFPCVVVMLILRLIPLMSDSVNYIDQVNPSGTLMCNTRNL